MKLAFGLVVCSALFAGTVTTDMVCPVGESMSVYAQEGFACTFGGLTFYDFSYRGSTSTGLQPALDADFVSVVPFSSDTETGFIFTGPFTAGLGSILDYEITFVGDPPPPLIRGYSVTLTRGVRRAPGPQGNATFSSVQCQTSVDGACEDYSVVTTYVTGSDQRLTDTVYFDPVPIVNATTRLTLDGTKGSIVIQSISSSFIREPAVVPEPSTALLLAAGLGLVLCCGPLTRFVRQCCGR